MRRAVFLLLPLSLLLTAVAIVTYFIRWDATHCTLCRARVDEYGRCPNPNCHLNRLTGQPEIQGA